MVCPPVCGDNQQAYALVQVDNNFIPPTGFPTEFSFWWTCVNPPPPLPPHPPCVPLKFDLKGLLDAQNFLDLLGHAVVVNITTELNNESLRLLITSKKLTCIFKCDKS